MSTLAGIRTLRGVVVAGLALCAPAPAAAQLFEYTRASDPSFSVEFASGAAYDPVHDVYFVVSGGTPVAGRFINRNSARQLEEARAEAAGGDEHGDKRHADVEPAINLPRASGRTRSCDSLRLALLENTLGDSRRRTSRIVRRLTGSTRRA